MTALLKLLAHDLGRCLWRGLVLSGCAQAPYLYDFCRAEARCAGVERTRPTRRTGAC